MAVSVKATVPGNLRKNVEDGSGSPPIWRLPAELLLAVVNLLDLRSLSRLTRTCQGMYTTLGAEMYHRDIDAQRTALRWALGRHDAVALGRMLAHGIPPNLVMPSNQLVLHVAIEDTWRAGPLWLKLDLVALLLERGADPNLPCPTTGMTALVAVLDRLAMVEHPSKKASSSSSSANAAAMWIHLSYGLGWEGCALPLVRLLLDAGANPHGAAGSGSGAHAAVGAAEQPKPLPSWMQSLQTELDPLRMAAALGRSVYGRGLCGEHGEPCHVRIVDALLDKGARPDPPAAAVTPLAEALFASEGRRRPLVRRLLDAGADPNRVARPPRTVNNSLWPAAEMRPIAMLARVVVRQSALDAPSAARSKSGCKELIDVLRMLLGHGADPNLDGYRAKGVGVSFLAMAQEARPTFLPRYDFIEALLEHGANPNLSFREGESTAQESDVLCTEMRIFAGFKADNQQDPQHVDASVGKYGDEDEDAAAAVQRQAEIICLLLEKGAWLTCAHEVCHQALAEVSSSSGMMAS